MAHRNFGRSGQMSMYGGGYGGGGGGGRMYGGNAMGGGMYGGGGFDKRSGGSYGGMKPLSNNYGYSDGYRGRDSHRGGPHPRGGSGGPPPRRGGDKRRSRSPHRSGHHDSGSARRDSRGSRSYLGKYEVKVPRPLHDFKELSVAHIKHLYSRLYIPSDFFHVDLRWQEVFPIHCPLKLGYNADFNVFHKDVEPLEPRSKESEDDPPDADYTFSAKVMLLASPPLADLYQKSSYLADETRDSSNPKMAANRQLHFLVGSKGKNEPMAIGGPWSPSLDGPNPDENPQVLINTAIRNCKALTGIDLSSCTQWFRFLELHYYRPADRVLPTSDTDGSTTKPREARVETVVIFVPDVWSCMPSDEVWAQQKAMYSEALEKLIAPPVQQEEPQTDNIANETGASNADSNLNTTTDSTGNTQDEEESGEAATTGDPTHHSLIDLKSMKVNDIKRELELRKLPTAGLKAQLSAKLQKAIEDEAEAEKKQKELKDAAAKQEVDKPGEEKPAEKTEAPSELTEKDRKRLERAYRMTDHPAIIVHPNFNAKGGRFDCHKMSLHALLDYRHDDQKEHTYEVSLFAEQFNSMIARDCAFNIYKALYSAPEPEEKKEPSKDETVDEESKDEPDSKRRRKDSDSLSTKDEDESTTEKTRKLKRTINQELLYSFSFYDTGHSDHILERDLDDIIQLLGLNLSRAQVRKLIGKIPAKKDSVLYRNLTDKEIVEGAEEDVLVLNRNVERPEMVLELSQGNKALFEEAPKLIPARTIVGASSDSGVLLDKLEESERLRLAIELQFDQLKIELEKTRKQVNTSKDSQGKLQEDLESVREKLRTERRLANESKQINSTYLSLLRFSKEQTEKVSKAIQGQFDKEKEEKEKEREAKKLAEAKAAAEAKAKEEADAVKSEDAPMDTDGAATEENGESSDKKEFQVVDSV